MVGDSELNNIAVYFYSTGAFIGGLVLQTVREQQWGPLERLDSSLDPTLEEADWCLAINNRSCCPSECCYHFSGMANRVGRLDKLVLDIHIQLPLVKGLLFIFWDYDVQHYRWHNACNMVIVVQRKQGCAGSDQAPIQPSYIGSYWAVWLADRYDCFFVYTDEVCLVFPLDSQSFQVRIQ